MKWQKPDAWFFRLRGNSVEIVLLMEHHRMKKNLRTVRNVMNNSGASIQATINTRCHNRWILTERRRVSDVSPSAISAFLKKTRTTYLQFFLTFFDKMKSRKRCKEMSNTASERPVPALLPYGILCFIIPYNPYCIPIMPISASGFARIRVWYRLFQGLIWAISRAEMVHFARPENIFLTQATDIQYIAQD